MRDSYRQAAVIPYRVLWDRVQIALVTTLSGRRWGVPKGSLAGGERPCDAAARETEEEAGLLGELTHRPIGRYRYSKRGELYDVDIFAMRVTTVLDSWLEAKYRSRRWMAVEDAIDRLRPEFHDFVKEAAALARTAGAQCPLGVG